MASAQAQRKWREKHKLVKSQLNVMAHKSTHENLNEISQHFELNGKADAVAFCAYVVKALLQKGERDATTFLYIDALKAGFKRARDNS